MVVVVCCLQFNYGAHRKGTRTLCMQLHYSHIDKRPKHAYERSAVGKLIVTMCLRMHFPNVTNVLILLHACMHVMRCFVQVLFLYGY